MSADRHTHPTVILREALDLAGEMLDSIRRELEAERANRRAAEAERDRATLERDQARLELSTYHASSGIAPRWRTQEKQQ